jgi:hypothetical protein
MSSVIVRPEPDAYQAGELAKGKTHIRWGISASWFSRGALEWDGAQLAVIDADGERHPVALPVGVGQLVRYNAVIIEGAATTDTWVVFVADEQDHRLIELPNVGFSLVTCLGDLSAAAGLRYAELRLDSNKRDFATGGYPWNKATLDLRSCVVSKADRPAIGHLLHRKDPRE